MKVKLSTHTLVTAAAMFWAAGAVDAQRVYLMVDRDSGEINAVSSVDIQIDSYTIKSLGGTLNPETWNSLSAQGADGWTEAQPRNQQLTELNWPSTGALAAGQPVSLGNAYAGAGVAPSDEDLRFEYGTPHGAFGVGSVRYTGAPQIPALLVDRQSGRVQLSNPAGFEIAGYSIVSDSGSLSPDGLTNGLADQGNAGWVEANLAATRLSELSLEQTHGINAANPLTIGNAFTPGGPEDLEFEYLTAGGVLSEGLVTYLGPINDFTLSVDLLSGQTSLTNYSGAAIDLVGYSIASPSGGLSVQNWSGIASDGWTAANPTAAAIAELNPTGSFSIASGDSVSLGNLFVGAVEDLTLEYSTADGGAAIGTVDYQINLGGGPVGPTCEDLMASRIGGDLDGNGEVAFADFLVMSTFFGQEGVGYAGGDVDCDGTVAFGDFLTLSSNFGQTAGAAVPEPESGLLGLVVACGLLAIRRQR